jgi:hypothetical protein
MRLTHLLAATAVLSMAALPALADPAKNPASKLSLADGAPPKDAKSGLKNTSVVAGVAVAAIVVGALALSKHDSKAASS